MERIKRIQSRVEVAVQNGAPMHIFGKELDKCDKNHQSTLFMLMVFMIMTIEMTVLSVKAGVAAARTIVFGSLVIFCRYIPHDGRTEHIIEREGKKLKITFTADGKWSPEEMKAHLWSCVAKADRFELAAFHTGEANVAMLVNDEWYTLESDQVISLLDTIEKIVEIDQNSPKANKQLIGIQNKHPVDRFREFVEDSVTNEELFLEQSAPTQLVQACEHAVVKKDIPTRRRKNKRNTRTEHTLVGKTTSNIAIRTHGGRKLAKEYETAEGSAYGYSWTKYKDGAQLVTKDMIASHLYETTDHDITLHGFPDMISKEIPEQVKVGDDVEYWNGSRLIETKVDSTMFVSGKFGNRTIWGIVPSFTSPDTLVSGTPIFKEKKLVSVITKSDGKGNYAISGMSRTSGHVVGSRLQARVVPSGYSVYGNMMGPYGKIKTEAVRVKNKNDNTPMETEIYIYTDRISIVTWRGDNQELGHVRAPALAKFSVEKDTN